MSHGFSIYLIIAFIAAVLAAGRWTLDITYYSLPTELAQITKASTTYARSLCALGLPLNTPATAAQLKAVSFTDLPLDSGGVRSAAHGISWRYLNADRGQLVLEAQTNRVRYLTRLKLLVPITNDLPGNTLQLTVPATIIGSNDRLRTYMRSEAEFECEV